MDDADHLSDATDRELLEAALLRAATAEGLVVAMLGVMHRLHPGVLDDELLRLHDDLRPQDRTTARNDLRHQTLARMRALLVDPRFDPPQD